MPTKPSKRKLEAASWESHREDISRLYVKEDRTLQEVQHTLAAEPYGFNRT